MIRAAIVGTGDWGQKLVRSVQNKSEKIRFTAAVARTPAKAKSFADELGLELHDDLQSALKRPDVDAVVLATPHSQHAAQVTAAAEAGKSIFVEKPFSLTRESAVSATEACRHNKVGLAVGYNRRFLPAIAAFKQIISAGTLGTIMQVEANQSSHSGYRHGPQAWRASRGESPAGGMTSLGVHPLDALTYLCGEISEVQTRSRHLALPIDIDDATAVLLQFKSGALGYLGTVFASAPYFRLQVFGSRGWTEMRGSETLIVGTPDGKTEERSFASIDMERVELEAFADTAARRESFPLSFAEIVHGVSVLEAIIESAKDGRSRTVD